MTLLDAIVGLAILGLTAVGFLGAFQSAARATRSSAEWVQAASYAETAMEETKLGAESGSLDRLPPGFDRAVHVEPWDDTRGIQRVTITITLPRGGSFAVQRLVRAP